MTASFRVILYEGRGARPIDSGRKAQVLRALLEKGYAATAVGGDGDVSGADTGVLLVLGQFDSGGAPPLDWALQGQVDGADRPVRVLFHNLDGAEPAAVLQAVEEVRSQSQIPAPGAWKPWFPVIDYARCTNCMQCLSFCLFDVYGVTKAGQITVQNQTNCKTDCPACSRVCPEVAILFPKYRFGPINGDEISSDDLRRQSMKVDISALLGGDIYQVLRDRSDRAKSRFSRERDEDRALAERQRCLVKLQEAMDIPPEVIASLPSLDQIQAKAQAAKARAQAAMKRNQ